MADKDFTIQVTHTVTETYKVSAPSGAAASVALGMHLGGGYEAGDEGTADPVTLMKTTKTVRHISQAKTLIPDDDPARTPSGG